ncbi:MAG: hypothetical protein OSB23_04000 [Porticoccaceae bacterium]|nr:hypothetical protein [Porticoccaceae bacterium]
MKQSQHKQLTDKLPCMLCRRIRIIVGVLILALAILAIKGDLSFIRGVSLTRIAADLIGLTLLLLLAWKSYQEYWKPYNARTDKRP